MYFFVDKGSMLVIEAFYVTSFSGVFYDDSI